MAAPGLSCNMWDLRSLLGHCVATTRENAFAVVSGSLTGDGASAPAVGTCSLRHWITKEGPSVSSFPFPFPTDIKTQLTPNYTVTVICQLLISYLERQGS